MNVWDGREPTLRRKFQSNLCNQPPEYFSLQRSGGGVNFPERLQKCMIHLVGNFFFLSIRETKKNNIQNQTKINLHFSSLITVYLGSAV